MYGRERRVNGFIEKNSIFFARQLETDIFTVVKIVYTAREVERQSKKKTVV